jgi:hypothetical protein
LKKLYIVQNETHLENFLALSAKDRTNSQFLFLDSICGLEINKDKHVEHLSSMRLSPILGGGIYKVSGFIRLIKLIICWRKREYRNLTTPDKIYIGNDGAIQKLVIQHFKRLNNDLEVELWSDGLLERVEPSAFRNIVHGMEPLLSYLRLDSFFPSIIGTSSLIERAFVMSDSCKKSLVFNGFRGSCVDVKTFPRHLNMQKIARKYHDFRILLVVSAFEWHGHSDIELWECELANFFSKVAELDKTTCKYSIRSHPRSSSKLKEQITKSGFESTIFDCSEDIVNSDVIISYASTCLFDGSCIGKKVFTYTKGAPYINRGDFVEALPELKELHNLPKFFDLAK